MTNRGGSVAEWLACWTPAQKARVQITVSTLSGNSLRQTAHTHCASVHQAAKLVAALLRVAGVTAGLAESNGSLPSVYDSRHQVTCRLTAKNRDQLRNPTLSNRVWATFTFLVTDYVTLNLYVCMYVCIRRSCLCCVWCDGVSQTIALDKFRLHIFCRATGLSRRESNSHCRSGSDTDKTVLSCLAWRCELALRATAVDE